MINVPLMRKVLEHITEHPEEHDQNNWAERTLCGTTYCMAGHAVVMAGHRLAWTGQHETEDATDTVETPVMTYVGWSNRISEVAAHELGLEDDQVAAFFYDSGDIEELWENANFYTNGEIEIPEQFKIEETI